MRIPIPIRINLKLGLIFIAVMFFAQLLEQTELTFAALCSLYFAIFIVAFNVCRGFENPMGAWIFFNGMITAVVGLVGKVILGQPAQTHLTDPDKTMLLYCTGMAVSGAAGFLAVKLARRPALLGNFLHGETMHRGAIGCLIVGTVITFMGNLLGVGSGAGSLGAILFQFNQFNRMALILDTYYIVSKTDGEKNFTWVVLTSGAILFFTGLLAYSKEGLFFPFVAWLLAAIAAGARFTRFQIIGGLLVTFFLVHYMVPYSQYGRRSRDAELGLSAQIPIVWDYLSDLEGTRKLYQQSAEETADSSLIHFYDGDQGLLDRENMLAIDDSLIQFTDDGNVFGFLPEYVSIANLVPHFLWPNKPTFASGNFYGREVGVIDSEDVTTGISFSPMADAYHQGTWAGVLLVLPAVVFLYGFCVNSTVGKLKDSPWALLPVAVSANVAPEGLLAGNFYIATYTMLQIIAIAFITRYILPLLVATVIGEGRGDKRARGRFRPAARRTTLLDKVAEPSGPAVR